MDRNRAGSLGEAAWADRWPRDRALFSPAGILIGLRGGRFGSPSGNYSRSDYGYTGFLRTPLIRYDGYFGVSNAWLKDGAVFTAGVPQLFVEASLSRGRCCGNVLMPR